MRNLLLLFCVISSIYCRREMISDIYELLKDPKFLPLIEKRLGASQFGALSEQFSDKVGCYDISGSLRSNCDFNANSTTIIKSTESIANGAVFLKEYMNVTCPRECTSFCCDTPNCDTAVYQDKGDHNCYLFSCGGDSKCVFVEHADYWTSSIFKETYQSHSYLPGGATHSHESDLENLSSHHEASPVTATVRTTTEKTTTRAPTAPPTTTSPALPGLGKYCPSYGSKCEDPHAECLMKSCRCRVGYHEKHGICRKHCRTEEFECENYAYYSTSDSRECIPNEYVCDGNRDCIDGSDELNCPDQNKQDGKQPPRKPLVNQISNKNNPINPHIDPPKPSIRPQITVQHRVSTNIPTTAAPIPTQPTKNLKSSGLNIVTTASQASTDNDQDVDKEPDNTDQEQSSDNQSTEKVDSKNTNSTETTDDKNGDVHKFNILNADSVEVASYTDSFQAPIVALALGLSITMMLLIFVGCRLRTVKRRLRKGRALHSNEADYLINGMYL